MNYKLKVTLGGKNEYKKIGSIDCNNDTDEVYTWPDFRPAFFVVHADGSEAYVAPGNYYSKAQGWPNGIAGTPPDIPPGASADWTWYTSTQAAGQYCSMVGVTFQDWVYLALYDVEGRLVETEIIPPQ